MKKMLATAAVLSTAAAAFAADWTGPGGALPDQVGGSFNQVVGENVVISDVDISLNSLTHTWVGDLTATVTHGAQNALLFSRPGSADGVGVGFGSDLNGTYRFDSDSANSFWTAAASTPVAPGTYDTSAPLNGAGTNSLDVFDGTLSGGNWNLSITDSAALDSGNLTSWTIHIVPEPTTLSLLALGGLAILRRR